MLSRFSVSSNPVLYIIPESMTSTSTMHVKKTQPGFFTWDTLGPPGQYLRVLLTGLGCCVILATGCADGELEFVLAGTCGSEKSNYSGNLPSTFMLHFSRLPLPMFFFSSMAYRHSPRDPFLANV